MICDSCTVPMDLLYDVVERDTLFLLWECECGHKVLERRPMEREPLTAVEDAG